MFSTILFLLGVGIAAILGLIITVSYFTINWIRNWMAKKSAKKIVVQKITKKFIDDIKKDPDVPQYNLDDLDKLCDTTAISKFDGEIDPNGLQFVNAENTESKIENLTKDGKMKIINN